MCPLILFDSVAIGHLRDLPAHQHAIGCFCIRLSNYHRAALVIFEQDFVSLHLLLRRILSVCVDSEPRKVHRLGFQISRQGRPREFIMLQDNAFLRKITVHQNHAIAERTLHSTAKKRSSTDEASVPTRKIRPPNHDPLKIAFSLINRRGWNQHY